MKPSRLDSRPGIREKVVADLAAGRSCEKIAHDVGMSASQVRRYSNREDILAMVKEQSLSMLEVTPDAVENIKDLVRCMKEIPHKNHKERELSFKATQKVLEAGGILNTQAPSQIFVNILAQQVNNTIPPEIVELLKIRDALAEPLGAGYEDI